MKPKRLPELYENDVVRFWSKVEQKGDDECWNWTCTALPDGRGQFTIVRRPEKFKRTLCAPRIVYALHYGRDPYPDDVLHNCNNANCVNPHHLRLGDDIDNCADSIAAGTCVHGERSHFAKLTDEDAKDIKTALMEGTAVLDLARDFKVDPATIYSIRKGEAWKHVEVPGFIPCRRRLLSETKVKAIKIALIAGRKTGVISKQFGMDPSTISLIKRGKTWKHVEVPGFKPSKGRGKHNDDS